MEISFKRCAKHSNKNIRNQDTFFALFFWHFFLHSLLNTDRQVQKLSTHIALLTKVNRWKWLSKERIRSRNLCTLYERKTKDGPFNINLGIFVCSFEVFWAVKTIPLHFVLPAQQNFHSALSCRRKTHLLRRQLRQPKRNFFCHRPVVILHSNLNTSQNVNLLLPCSVHNVLWHMLSTSAKTQISSTFSLGYGESCGNMFDTCLM